VLHDQSWGPLSVLICSHPAILLRGPVHLARLAVQLYPHFMRVAKADRFEVLFLDAGRQGLTVVMVLIMARLELLNRRHGWKICDLIRCYLLIEGETAFLD
jgi:hypothetical protein